MTALPERILLVDHSSALCRAWTQAFSRYQHIEVIEGDFFAHDADAMVSPANSFGIMDGGLDRAIRETIGSSIESSVQQLILERHHGEIPIGCAEIVATPNPRWPWLVVAHPRSRYWNRRDGPATLCRADANGLRSNREAGANPELRDPSRAASRAPFFVLSAARRVFFQSESLASSCEPRIPRAQLGWFSRALIVANRVS